MHGHGVKRARFGAIFVWPIAQLLNFFAQYVGALLSIVIVTLLIRLLTIRGSIKSTIQQQKMQLLGLEQAKIEEKYRNRTDQQSKMAKATEMQKLYQKHDIKPMSAIGGQLLQLPIMIAMYYAVTRADLIISGTVFGETLEKTPMQGFQEMNVVYITIFALMVIFQALSMFLPQYLAKQKLKKYPNQKQPKKPKKLNDVCIISNDRFLCFNMEYRNESILDDFGYGTTIPNTLY
ncbi:YidC/Oxa1 family membrane protein insertase [Erysipelothrix sp. D19-032]